MERQKFDPKLAMQLDPLVGNGDFVFHRANRRKLSIPVSCGEYSYKQVKLLCGQGAIYAKLKSGLNCLICDGDVNSSSDHDLPGKYVITVINLGPVNTKF